MEILLIFVIAYAAKHGWDQAWEAWRKSRAAYMKNADARFPDMPAGKRTGHALRHDIGYGLSQVRHGFPQARHGFAAGWHKGRQAHAQALAGREKAKAEHLETRARLIPDLREYRRRQKEALEQIRAGDEPREPEEGSEGSQGTRRVDGQPETEADKKFFDLRESGYTGPIDQDGNIPDPSDPDAARALDALDSLQRSGQQEDADCDLCGYPLPAGYAGIAHPDCIDALDLADITSPTEGTDMPDTTAGDTTYAGVKTQMQAATAQAEQWQADANSAVQGSDEYVTEVQQAKTAASTMADEMQALEVDAASLGAMAEHLEALDAAEQAAVALQEAAQQVKAANDRVVESAQNVSSTLDASGHGALDEAHANAAGGGARKDFYGE